MFPCDMHRARPQNSYPSVFRAPSSGGAWSCCVGPGRLGLNSNALQISIHKTSFSNHSPAPHFCIYKARDYAISLFKFKNHHVPSRLLTDYLVHWPMYENHMRLNILNLGDITKPIILFLQARVPFIILVKASEAGCKRRKKKNSSKTLYTWSKI